MRWCLSLPESAEYILPITLSTSVTPVSLHTYRRSWKMYFEAVIERVWRCTWRLWLSELRDALGGRDPVNLEKHLETERLSELRDVLAGQNWAILEMQLGTERSSELRDALGGRNWVSLKMHLEAMIEWTERCGWKLWLSEFGDALGSRDWVCWQIQVEARIDQDWRSTRRRLIWSLLILRWLIWRRSIGMQWILRQWIWRQWIWRRWIGRHIRWKLRLYLLVNS